MKKVKLLFGIHCHQPVGNFEDVFEKAYEQAYLPFIKTLENHPRIKASVHYSGVLYDWFVEKHPEFIDLLKKLVRRRQIEILSGGYYEPILSIIPDDDKIGQIETMNEFLKEKLGVAPQGMWLAERVWEPHFPKILSQAGIEYVPIDDYHFLSAGLSQKDLFGYYITEEQGNTLKVFPINKQLRYLIPKREPQETLDYLKSIAKEKEDVAAIFIDDGEEFGFRDGTNKQYLEDLFSKLEANSDWIQFITFSDYIEEYPPLGRVYLPSASYEEMMEWSGGVFRNFFIKYSEANNMHKKMLYVSNRLHTLRKGKVLIGEREKDKQLRDAIQNLYQGQCSCAYWHGLFGGIYLKHLRNAVYAHLIAAEKEIEKHSRGGRPYVDLTMMDFDKDGRDEVILANDLLSLYFSPAYGGSLFELDYKPKTSNLLNTLARRQESYHQKKEKPVYDSNLRYSLLDRFLAQDTTLKAFSAQSFKEIGGFAAAPYSFFPKRSSSEVGLKLMRQGKVEDIPLRVEKHISLCAKQSIINIEYNITNLGEVKDEFWFGVEFNFSLEDQHLLVAKELNKALGLKIVDASSKFEVLLESSQAALIWCFPIETVSQSEKGLETNYQGLAVFPSWKFSLGPNESWKVKLSLKIEE